MSYLGNNILYVQNVVLHNVLIPFARCFEYLYSINKSSLTPKSRMKQDVRVNFNLDFLNDMTPQRQKIIPCFPLVISTYWQSLGWVTVLRIWKRPRILIELGVRGRPLLPQTSWGRAEAKKVKAPSCASLRGFILSLAGGETNQFICMTK